MRIKKWMRFVLIFCMSFTGLQSSFGQYNSLLWEVSGNGLAEPSYLFGTIHISDPRVFEWGDSLMICFNKCHTMAGELAMEDINKQEVAAAMRMPGDTTLKMLLSKKDYKIVKREVRKKYGFVYTLIINKIKPVYTSMLLSEAAPKKKSKKDMDSFLDLHLQKLAHNRNMRVTGLETPQEQLKAIDALSLSSQAAMLLEDLNVEEDVTDSSAATLENMIQQYLKENLDFLVSEFVDEKMPPEMLHAMLYNRNQVMAQRMQPLIVEHASFIAVGAAHLAGDKGLVALLRDKGFTVRPVPSRKK